MLGLPRVRKNQLLACPGSRGRFTLLHRHKVAHIRQNGFQIRHLAAVIYPSIRIEVVGLLCTSDGREIDVDVDGRGTASVQPTTIAEIIRCLQNLFPRRLQSIRSKAFLSACRYREIHAVLTTHSETHTLSKLAREYSRTRRQENFCMKIYAAQRCEGRPDGKQEKISEITIQSAGLTIYFRPRKS